jgi:ketosteroid isomerase-like protein
MSKDLVEHFYSSFAAKDADAMAACYADDIVFEDPAFGELRGEDARDMWRMLCARATDLTIEHTILDSSDSAAKVNWIASYTFSAGGRHVRNDIVASMRFADGKIVEHRDVFDLWKWSRQALGVPGMLLGWSPPMQKKVRATALGNLAKYQAKNR